MLSTPRVETVKSLNPASPSTLGSTNPARPPRVRRKGTRSRPSCTLASIWSAVRLKLKKS